MHNYSDENEMKIYFKVKSSVYRIHSIEHRPRSNVADHGNKITNKRLPRINALLGVISWLQWKCSFLSIVNKHAPLRTMRVRTRSSPWITSELKKRMHDRDIERLKQVKRMIQMTSHFLKNNAI